MFENYSKLIVNSLTFSLISKINFAKLNNINKKFRVKFVFNKINFLIKIYKYPKFISMLLLKILSRKSLKRVRTMS